MSLIFMDGFRDNNVLAKWSVSSATYTVLNATPRTPGGYYGQFTNNGVYISKAFTAASQVFVGFGLRTTSTVGLTFYGDGGGTGHISVVRSVSTGYLEIRRGGTTGTLLATGTSALLPSQWNYIEASCTISDTIGEVHVRLNGSTTDEVSYTGDTKNGGTNTTIDAALLINVNNATTHFSDVYILNSSGASPNNTFLGDIVVHTLAVSGNGNSSQLTGSDGNQIDNYLLIDEIPQSGADYAGSATTGLKDTYAMANLPAGVTSVYGVQTTALMAKSDATLAQGRVIKRSAGTDYPATTRVLTTTYTNYYELFENDPATGVLWTPANVNNMESGMEVM